MTLRLTGPHVHTHELTGQAKTLGCFFCMGWCSKPAITWLQKQHHTSPCANGSSSRMTSHSLITERGEGKDLHNWPPQLEMLGQCAGGWGAIGEFSESRFCLPKI